MLASFRVVPDPSWVSESFPTRWKRKLMHASCRIGAKPIHKLINDWKTAIWGKNPATAAKNGKPCSCKSEVNCSANLQNGEKSRSFFEPKSEKAAIAKASVRGGNTARASTTCELRTRWRGESRCSTPRRNNAPEREYRPGESPNGRIARGTGCQRRSYPNCARRGLFPGL